MRTQPNGLRITSKSSMGRLRRPHAAFCSCPGSSVRLRPAARARRPTQFGVVFGWCSKRCPKYGRTFPEALPKRAEGVPVLLSEHVLMETIDGFVFHSGVVLRLHDAHPSRRFGRSSAKPPQPSRDPSEAISRKINTLRFVVWQKR